MSKPSSVSTHIHIHAPRAGRRAWAYDVTRSSWAVGEQGHSGTVMEGTIDLPSDVTLQEATGIIARRVADLVAGL